MAEGFQSNPMAPPPTAPVQSTCAGRRLTEHAAVGERRVSRRDGNEHKLKAYKLNPTPKASRTPMALDDIDHH